MPLQFLVSIVTSLLGFGVEPLNVPMPCGLVQHSVTTLLACRASVAAAAQLTPVVSEDGVVCLPAELATLTCTHPPGTAPILPGDPGACEGPWMDGWLES